MGALFEIFLDQVVHTVPVLVGGPPEPPTERLLVQSDVMEWESCYPLFTK